MIEKVFYIAMILYIILEVAFGVWFFCRLRRYDRENTVQEDFEEEDEKAPFEEYSRSYWERKDDKQHAKFLECIKEAETLRNDYYWLKSAHESECEKSYFDGVQEGQKQAEEKKLAAQACMDFLISESGADTCSKCVYAKDTGEDCVCRIREREGAEACREGMIKFFSKKIELTANRNE